MYIEHVAMYVKNLKVPSHFLRPILVGRQMPFTTIPIRIFGLILSVLRMGPA